MAESSHIKIEDMSVEVVNQPSTSKESSDSETNSEVDDVQEGNTELVKTSRRRKRPFRRSPSKLNPNLKGLMGEANLRYARGDIETAKKMCFEIMRQVPDAYEPYITLAQIFENTDLTKYEGYLAIASCLYSHDAGIWCRLAELNQHHGKIKEAISCYSKAIRANPRNTEYHMKRLELVEGIGDHKLALACKRNMANHLPKSQFNNIIEICKDVAKKYHAEKNDAKALEALEIPFKRVPNKITHDLVNMMLELLLATERFAECLDCFIQYCNFTFEITVNNNREIIVMSYELPLNLPIDLKTKFISCLIKLKSIHLISPLIDQILIEENVEEIGDLYLDLAEDLMTAKYYEEALKLLVPLVKSHNFSMGAVWLKYAECLHNCNLLEQAVEAYFTVMTIAPQHVEILYPLAMALLKLNKKSEALDVLSQDLSSNTLDVAVLIERMKLLKQIGDLDDYWNCCQLLLSRHCLVIKYPEEIKIAFTSQTIREKMRRIQLMRNFRADDGNIETNFESIREPSVDKEYELYKNVLKFALELKQYSQFQRFAIMGLTSKKFQNNYKEIFLYAFLSCIYNNDTFHGYTLIRDIVIHDTQNNLAWNLFNVLLQHTDDVRHTKFIIRMQERLPNVECLQVIDANYGLSVGNYNLALKYYMKEFKKNRTPYLSFILGVILLQHYTRRIYMKDKKKLAEIVSYLFLNYANSRSKDAEHETYYNLGRMYQQLGVNYLAEHYYLRVLNVARNEFVEKYPEVLDLKYEAAYNLHIIYKNSGNLIEARNILIRHIVI